jgi:hypothetical protein
MEILAADGAAITLAYNDPERVTLSSTNLTSERLENLQEILGEGPGPDAYTSGHLVVARVGGPETERWPLFLGAAREALGAMTVFAVPMRPGTTSPIGVLTLFRAGEVLSDLSQRSAQFLADAVGAAILNDHVSQGETPDDDPWPDRAQVHQATGMVVTQLRLAPEDALALMRAHAYAHETTLAGIAQEVVERRLDFRSTDAAGGVG